MWRVSAKVAGLRKRRVEVPSLVMSSVAVRVMPQPSPVVVEGREGAEGGAVEDEAGVDLPGPLDEVGAASRLMPSPKYCWGMSSRWRDLPVSGWVTVIAE